MNLEEIKGKNLAIWGLGVEGQATFHFLSKRIENFSCTFLTEGGYTPNLPEEVKKSEIISAVNTEILKQFEIVFKSPGISSYRDDILAAKASGVQFTSATQLWFDLNREKKTICITGSKGKSTCSSLTSHLLQTLGYKVALCGNIGLPLLALDDQFDYYVVELSSYQLADLNARFTAAVLLNLYSEHLDWHRSLENYFRDKLNIFKNPTIRITNGDDREIAQRVRNPEFFFNSKDGLKIEDHVVIYKGERVAEFDRFVLEGVHNLHNLEAACSVVLALQLDLSRSLKNISQFTPLPHRMTRLGVRNEIEFIDDSISTIPEASMAAMKSLEGKFVTLLAGGFDRGQDFSELASYLKRRGNCALVALPENGIRLFKLLNATLPSHFVETLEMAISKAKDITPPNGVILLSPGAPSYGAFKNYMERGNLFQKLAGFAV